MLVPLAISAAVAALLAPFALRTFAAAGRTRENYRGRSVVFPAGVIALTASVVSLGVLGPWGHESGLLYVAPGAAVLALGAGLLGLADDLLEGSGRGLRGHARALARGELTTGALKAIGIPALALWTMSGQPDWLLSAVLIALTANLFNLLDLRPGRAVKAFVLVGAALCFAGHAEWLQDLGAFIGPLLVLGFYDLRERAMLGDTGSNVLGALAGLWLVLALGTTGELVALTVVAALTLFGEVRSISATIDAVAPLRWLDRIGRRAEDAGSTP